MKQKYKGFTLIELMIVVAIIGVLSAIAIPSYSKYLIRGKRAEARNALLHIAASQERYYSDNNQYGLFNEIDRGPYKLAGGNDYVYSENSNYKIRVEFDPDNQGFKLTARPETFSDPECTKITLKNTGGKGKGGTGDKSDCWSR